MLEPDYNFSVRPGSAVFTFGALEQLAGNLDKIIEYFFKQPAAIYVHVEPAIELYDPTRLEDYLASLFPGPTWLLCGFNPTA